jgi:hypothetical protein
MSEPVSRGSDEASQDAPSREQGEQPERAINVEELAERVYRLMREEARLERARGVTVGSKRRKR